MKPRLTINLAAVAANYRLLRETAGGVAAASVVKADGYGLGAIPIAERLYQEGCRIFFVATLDEALALRPHIGDATLYVFGGLFGAKPEDFTAHNIRPVLNESAEIEVWLRHNLKNCILHVDTGMNRLGLPPSDITVAGGLRPDYVMSHLANAETPDDPKNAQQKEAFDTIRKHFPDTPASLAATAGSLMGADYAFDLIRPGIGLYGGNPFAGRPNPLQDVIRIDAPILQIRTLQSGDTVGYGGTFKAMGGERIATLGIGYADG